MADDADLGPTAAIITIGDEIVEGRVLNENASWLPEELMARGVWPRLVVAVPDVSDLIVRVLRIAGDRADLLFVCGGLGFTPDDITRDAVATAFFRDVHVDPNVARRFLRDTRGQMSASPPPPPFRSTPSRWRPRPVVFLVSGFTTPTCCPGSRLRCAPCSAG